MPKRFDDESSRDYFTDKYARGQSPTALKVERMVLGHEVGLGGYTTMEQAGHLCDRMSVKSGARVLDLGTGRGWPGAFLARCMQSRMVFSDLPVGVLREAVVRFGTGESSVGVAGVAADGRAMPFQSEVFDAIVHADVF